MTFKEHEGSFLVGMMAAMASKTGKVGFVGGMDVPLIRKFQCGYEQGAKYANPKAEVFANMTGTTPTAWNDPARGGELAKAQFAKGVDVVFAAAGGSGAEDAQRADDLAGGRSDYLIARYLPSGILDTSFSGDGYDIRQFGTAERVLVYALAVQADDKPILITEVQVETDPSAPFSPVRRLAGLIRYQVDGALDTSYGTAGTGRVLLDYSGGTSSNSCFCGAIDSQGRLVMAGQYQAAIGGGARQPLFLTRITSSGVPDTTYGGGDGWATLLPADADASPASGGRGRRGWRRRRWCRGHTCRGCPRC